MKQGDAKLVREALGRKKKDHQAVDDDDDDDDTSAALGALAGQPVTSNVALVSEGAQCVAATSSDPRFPASQAIDGHESSFWLTTGMFPQELVVALPSAALLRSIRTITRNVRTLLVESCDKIRPKSFSKLFETDLDQTTSLSSGGYQKYEEKLSDVVQAYYIRMKITRAWSNFAAVHSIEAQGRPADFVK
mmetsp:Transcript_6594/g.13065  ORF Transcript_6594/g.13065 Transcript_6594/m.13065 type:complete len:191 (-) Transcript_6594:137-709(-)